MNLQFDRIHGLILINPPHISSEGDTNMKHTFKSLLIAPATFAGGTPFGTPNAFAILLFTFLFLVTCFYLPFFCPRTYFYFKTLIEISRKVACFLTY